MVPNIRNGASFTGAGLYYFHDKGAETDERVAWTHTINCNADEPDLALKEMRTTAANQSLLKEAAGIPLTGNKTKDTVKTISLAWAPGETPDREAMIAAAEGFLKEMGWQEHQAILVSHNDTEHRHVHILLNRVHPETGMTLDDRKDQIRAQKWALGYEREQGVILCPARVEKYERGEGKEATGVPREIWASWKDRSGDLDAHQSMQDTQNAADWGYLKQGQRDERDAFRDTTKTMIREMRYAIYREVKEEFRDSWSDYFDRKSEGAPRETLREMRALIMEQQKEVTHSRQDDAIKLLRGERHEAYQFLLKDHREERKELREYGSDDPRSARALEQIARGRAAIDPQQAEQDEEKREKEKTEREEEKGGTSCPPVIDEPMVAAAEFTERPPQKDASDAVVNGALNAVGKIAESLGSLFDGVPAKPNTRAGFAVPRNPEPAQPTADQLEKAINRFGIKRGAQSDDDPAIEQKKIEDIELYFRERRNRDR
jgi:hypothetical protein